MDVVVPDLGDFSDVEIIDVLVKPGDTVKPEDPLVTLETDKATMDVPAPAGGVVKELKVAKGDHVSSGDLVLLLDAETAEPQERASATEPASAPTHEATGEESGGTEETEELVTVPDLGDFKDVEVIEILVSPGERVAREQGLITLETDKATMDVPAPVAGTLLELKVAVGDRVSSGDSVATLRAAATQPEPAEAVSADAAPGGASPAPSAAEAPTPRRAVGPSKLPPIDEQRFVMAHASPAVRKLARELGVDLGQVRGSGHKGRVTAEDVKAFVKSILQGGQAGMAWPKVPEVDFAKFGEIELAPLSRIQKISGPRLLASWVNIPHVTQHDEADITDLEAKRKALKAEADKRGAHLTPLAFVLRACALALAEFPQFKASLADDGEHLVMKRYTHLGFAADTPNGLVVPVIRDADQMDVMTLAEHLGTLSAKARDGKLSPQEMQGGVFTVSSLGGIGGTGFTPVVNAPEVAILGVSRSVTRPVYVDGRRGGRLRAAPDVAALALL